MTTTRAVLFRDVELPSHRLASLAPQMAQKYVEQNIHPLKIVQGFARALEDAVGFLGAAAIAIDPDNKADMQRCVAPGPPPPTTFGPDNRAGGPAFFWNAVLASSYPKKYLYKATDGGGLRASCLGTKAMGRLDVLLTGLAIDAVKTVYHVDKSSGRKEVDFKRCLRAFADT